MPDGERRDALLAAVDAAFERHNRGRRGPVEIVPILPDHHTKMFFGSFRPERSRQLIEEGRRDARAVLGATRLPAELRARARRSRSAMMRAVAPQTVSSSSSKKCSMRSSGGSPQCSLR